MVVNKNWTTDKQSIVFKINSFLFFMIAWIVNKIIWNYKQIIVNI